MSLRRFEARERIACTVEQAFDFVADHRNVPRVLEGVRRWDPLGDRGTGVGARFEVEMDTMGLPLSNVLVLSAWSPPHRIGWRSESGLIRQQGEWRFAGAGDASEVRLSIAYEPPGGLLGGLVAARVDGIVRRRLMRALRTMRELLEREPGPRAASRTPPGRRRRT